MVKFRNTNTHWGLTAIGFHWLSVLVVIGLFSFGLWMTSLNYYHPWYKTAPELHKSIGILFFIFTIARLLWRYISPSPSPLENYSLFEIKATRLMHSLLYVLLFCTMFSGYLISTADGRGIDIFKLFQIPAIITGIDQQEDIAGLVHLVLAITLISFSLMHAIIAIKHHLVDKDTTLKRMLGNQTTPERRRL